MLGQKRNKLYFDYESEHLDESPPLFEEFCKKVTKATYKNEKDCSVLVAPIDSLDEVLKIIKASFQYDFLVDYFAVEDDDSLELELIFLFKNFNLNKNLKVITKYKKNYKLNSYKGFWSNIQWYERELSEMFGVQFLTEQENLFYCDSLVGNPMRKKESIRFDEKNKTKKYRFPAIDSVFLKESNDVENFVFGLESSFSKGLFKAHLELVDGKIRRSFFELGFNHRCVEKICEQMQPRSLIPIIERLNLSAGFNYSFAFCKTIEEHNGIIIPERAMALRMVFCELNRIFSHLTFLEAIFYESQMNTQYSDCFNIKFELFKIFEDLSGSRLFLSFNVIGGVKENPPRDWAVHVLEKMKEFDRTLRNIVKEVLQNRSWCEQMKMGKVSAKEAIDWGLTGPALRASGINYDVRKNKPYYFYDDLDFEVPLGVFGQSYDRILVHFEEMLQSISIIGQILDNLPLGAICEEESCSLEVFAFIDV